MNRVVISSFFLSLYLQALGTYFYITGATGTRSSVLTAVFQIGSLSLFLLASLGIKECRKRLQTVRIIDLLLLAFFVAVVLDLTIGKIDYPLPENLLIYFVTYSFAMAIARCLTLPQFKLILYFTSIIAILTSILIYRDYLSGVAVEVNNASRLAVGSSGNPIEAGNLGAYAALMSLFLSLKARSLPVKVVLLVLMYPGAMVSILSGTRSAVLSLAIGSIFIVSTTLFLKLKDFGSRLKQFSVSSLIYGLLVLMVLFGAPVISSASRPAAADLAASPTAQSPLDRTLNRLSNIPLLSDQAPDDSVGARYSFYGVASKAFGQNPLWGGRVYSVGFVHNAFLQVLAEFGIFGVVTYILPIFWLCGRTLYTAVLSLKRSSAYFHSDDWTVTAFMVLVTIQAMFVLLVHAEPYRSYFPPCAIGMMIAFSRLGIDKKLRQPIG